MAFYKRVLAQIARAHAPSEVFRFYAIAAAALDEFDAVNRARIDGADPDNTRPEAIDHAVRKRIHHDYAACRRQLYRTLVPGLVPAPPGAVPPALLPLEDAVSGVYLHGTCYRLAGERFVRLSDGTFYDALMLHAGHAGGVPFYIVRNAEINTGHLDAGDQADCHALLRRRTQARVMRLETIGRPPAALRRLFNPVQMAQVPVVAAAQLRALVPHDPVAASVSAPTSWEALRRRDVLLHHPYDSFDPVVRFCVDAAADPAVRAIDHTLYRTSEPSPLVEALCAAARAGKRVRAIVELRARFDEAANLRHAHLLQEAGVEVRHGPPEYKVHAKVTVVERAGQHYAHFGTGNYHPGTARSYVDYSLFTAAPDLTTAALRLFDDPLRADGGALFFAPAGLRDALLRRIEGENTIIRAKMNGLTDLAIADALRRAAQRGVDVRLSVRGMCVMGGEKNLRIRSVIGTLLEHARVFMFGDAAEAWLSSADCMPRNLDRRIEVFVPVRDPEQRQRLMAHFDAEFADTVRARVLGRDGVYRAAVGTHFDLYAYLRADAAPRSAL